LCVRPIVGFSTSWDIFLILRRGLTVGLCL
jgi:hypothetical protein